MIKNSKINSIITRLENEYPQAVCTLEYEKDYELLIATRLAAQCTDARVNTVMPVLTARYPTLEMIANADAEELEVIIRPCGFYHTKARDIIGQARELLANFDGHVPDTMESLLSLPGVGRKTANLILGDVFKKPAVVVDTHCIRLSNRLGLVKTKDPVKIEDSLRVLIPPEKSSDFCHRLVLHGRAVCRARNAMCRACVLEDLCPAHI